MTGMIGLPPLEDMNKESHDAGATSTWIPSGSGLELKRVKSIVKEVEEDSSNHDQYQDQDQDQDQDRMDDVAELITEESFCTTL